MKKRIAVFLFCAVGLTGQADAPDRTVVTVEIKSPDRHLVPALQQDIERLMESHGLRLKFGESLRHYGGYSVATVRTEKTVWVEKRPGAEIPTGR